MHSAARRCQLVFAILRTLSSFHYTSAASVFHSDLRASFGLCYMHCLQSLLCSRLHALKLKQTVAAGEHKGASNFQSENFQSLAWCKCSVNRKCAHFWCLQMQNCTETTWTWKAVSKTWDSEHGQRCFVVHPPSACAVSHEFSDYLVHATACTEDGSACDCNSVDLGLSGIVQYNSLGMYRCGRTTGAVGYGMAWGSMSRCQPVPAMSTFSNGCQVTTSQLKAWC